MRSLFLKAAGCLWAFGMILWPETGVAEPAIGIGELDSLIARHPVRRNPRLTGEVLKDVVRYQSIEGAGTTAFIIPGFQNYDCGKCHSPDRLVQKAAHRMQRAFRLLKQAFPEIQGVPLRQYIIQPYTDSLLHSGQLAHATFDTIRISPASILIDIKAYGEATHLHETLHLTQPFLGHVNELEAYGLNIQSDPRFLLLNYPYFAGVLRTFFIPDLDKILKAYFERGIQEKARVPRETQWFLKAFDEATLKRLAEAIQKVQPLLKEVSRLYRKYPLQSAYWSDRTGVRSLLLEIAAVKLLPLPELTVSEETREWAFGVFDVQFNKDDNTRLGYVIDRKRESLMHLRYGKGPNDPVQRRALYFHYLKKKFVDEQGEVQLAVDNRQALADYVNAKVKNIEKMAESPSLTPVEKQAARQLARSIKRELQRAAEAK